MPQSSGRPTIPIHISAAYEGWAKCSIDPASARTASNWPSLAPGGEGLVERTLARRALFDRDDGASLVGVDQRHVEPRTLLQELDSARAGGVDIGQAEHETA